MATTTTIIDLEDLTQAESGSFYAIRGVGGDVTDWVNGYEQEMADRAIGKPVAWFRTTGGAINDYARPENPDDRFTGDLAVLMFPLDGLDVGKLAIFRLVMGDIWFDDMVCNVRSVPKPDSEEDEDGLFHDDNDATECERCGFIVDCDGLCKECVETLDDMEGTR